MLSQKSAPNRLDSIVNLASGYSAISFFLFVIKKLNLKTK
jgi:hypothetical protein